MVTRKAILAIVDEAYHLSIKELAEGLGLPMKEATRIAVKLIGDGTLLPMDQAYLARPTKEGLPAPFTSMKKSDGSWRTAQMQIMLDWMKKQPEMGVSIADVEEAVDGVTANVARLVLKAMVVKDLILTRESQYGGIFGHRPKIFGLTPEALDAREQLYLVKQKDRQAVAKQSKKKVTPTRRPSSKASGEKLVVDFSDE